MNIETIAFNAKLFSRKQMNLIFSKQKCTPVLRILAIDHETRIKLSVGRVK